MECAKIVGIGTDGASANIADAGLKGLVEKDVVYGTSFRISCEGMH